MINPLWNNLKSVRNLSLFKLFLKNMSLKVETLNGPVIGMKNISLFGDEYIGFYQIPYAKPPVKDLRFKESYPYHSEIYPNIIIILKNSCFFK